MLVLLAVLLLGFCFVLDDVVLVVQIPHISYLISPNRHPMADIVGCKKM